MMQKLRMASGGKSVTSNLPRMKPWFASFWLAWGTEVEVATTPLLLPTSPFLSVAASAAMLRLFDNSHTGIRVWEANICMHL